MLLSIVIVSYNTAELTLQTLQSAISEISNSASLYHQTDIWVVDNNSSDSSIIAVQKIKQVTQIPIHLIANAENVGFAKANNQAIDQSTGEFILLLNSDTVLKPGSLDRLVSSIQKTADRPAEAVLASHHGELDHLGILAAKLENPDGTWQPQGGSFPTLISLAAHMLLLDDLPWVGTHLPSTQHTGQRATASINQTNQLQASDWVAGTAMLLRREMLNEIGLLDQSIFMYGEDVELCMRAKFHHWDVALDPQAPVIHYGSASSSSQNAIIGELTSYRYIWSKHYPLWQLPLARALLKLGCLLRIGIFGTMVRRPAKVAAYRKALTQV